MKTGRRVANPTMKTLAGTYRDDRHGDIVALADPPKIGPKQPPYLTQAARLVWEEELSRVVACGVTEADSSIFGRYCECEAAFRREIMAGELPKAALLTELRRMAELLGIAGLRSRLAKAPDAAPAKASPFTIRPA